MNPEPSTKEPIPAQQQRVRRSRGPWLAVYIAVALVTGLVILITTVRQVQTVEDANASAERAVVAAGMIANNRPDEALNEIRGTARPSPVLRALEAQVYLDKGRPAEARQLIQAAEKASPKSAAVLTVSALVARESGDTAKARKDSVAADLRDPGISGAIRTLSRPIR